MSNVYGFSFSGPYTMSFVLIRAFFAGISFTREKLSVEVLFIVCTSEPLVKCQNKFDYYHMRVCDVKSYYVILLNI